jgi:3-oxoacyl-[acyl-carrier protein] reductase
MKLDGMVAIVTGGGSGIGRVTAILLAKKGVKVVVCGRRYDVLLETVNIIQNNGGEAIAIQTDIQKSSEIINLVNLAKEKFGQINILINNAGVAIAKPLLEIEELEWDTVINTNLKSVFLTCRSIIPHILKTEHGVVVNVSSILGKHGIANFTAYSASKFGVIGLTQSLAQEYKSEQIRIYAICPGRTATDMQHQLGGLTIMELSMSAEKVANKIIDIIIGRIHLRSGSDVVIDEQSVKLKLYEVSIKWEQEAEKIKHLLYKLKRLFKRLV